MNRSAAPRPATDPLSAEVFRNALIIAAEEAGIVVVRGAHSTFIIEGADAAAAILDADGRLVAHSMSTALAHAASLRGALPHLLEARPLASMAPGDVFVMNEVIRGGIHANDLIVFRPVFVEGAPEWFTGTLIHVADLGGLSAGGMAADATDVLLEGLQLPPVKLADADGLVPDVAAILAANSRQPTKLLGDVRALVAGTVVAGHRVEALVAEHGPAGFRAGVHALWEHTESRMRDELATLPAGVHDGAYPIDDDGRDLGRALWIRARVTVGQDGHVAVDFDGTDDQVRAAVNAGSSQVVSGVLFALRSFIDPSIPMNEGCFRPIDVRLPEGSLVNPRWPVPGGGRYITVSAAVEAIFDALRPAAGHHAVAASGILQGFSIGGERDGETWLHMAFDFGGGGGRTGFDGLDAAGGLFGGGRNLVPQVEPIEAALPLRIERVELLDGSGGDGRWRGGRGTRTVIELLTDALIDTRGDRLLLPPAGRDGGSPGRPGSYRRVAPDGTVTTLPTKATNLPFAPGDRFVMETSGGGGLGPAAR